MKSYAIMITLLLSFSAKAYSDDDFRYDGCYSAMKASAQNEFITFCIYGSNIDSKVPARFALFEQTGMRTFDLKNCSIAKNVLRNKTNGAMTLLFNANQYVMIRDDISSGANFEMGTTGDVSINGIEYKFNLYITNHALSAAQITKTTTLCR